MATLSEHRGVLTLTGLDGTSVRLKPGRNNIRMDGYYGFIMWDKLAKSLKWFPEDPGPATLVSVNKPRPTPKKKKSRKPKR